jgi:hypothetical protein
MEQFTRTQRRALCALRRAYQQQHGDLFNGAELARLRFLRWLCQTERLVP